MSKKGKLIALGLIAISGVALYVVNKLSKVEKHEVEPDFDEDDFDEDDFLFDEEGYFEDEDDDDFEYNVNKEDSIRKDFIESKLGILYEDAKNIILDSENISFTPDELDSLTSDDFIEAYKEAITDEDTCAEVLDTFKMLNNYTREEVADILVKADAVVYDRDTLLALTDGELTQVYADWKVGQK